MESEELYNLLSGEAYIEWFCTEATPQDILEDFPTPEQQVWLIGEIICSLPIDELEDEDLRLCLEIMKILDSDLNCMDDIKMIFLQDLVGDDAEPSD